MGVCRLLNLKLAGSAVFRFWGEVRYVKKLLMEFCITTYNFLYHTAPWTLNSEREIVSQVAYQKGRNSRIEVFACLGIPEIWDDPWNQCSDMLLDVWTHRHRKGLTYIDRHGSEDLVGIPQPRFECFRERTDVGCDELDLIYCRLYFLECLFTDFPILVTQFCHECFCHFVTEKKCRNAIIYKCSYRIFQYASCGSIHQPHVHMLQNLPIGL